MKRQMKRILSVALIVCMCITMLPMQAKAAQNLYWPLDTRYGITTGYYYSNGNPHYGVDMAAPKGTPLYANFSGTAIFYQTYTTISGTNYLTSYGNCIYLTASDGPYWAVYGHLDAFEGYNLKIPSSQTRKQGGSTGKIEIGRRNVKEGELLGYVGTTGNSTGNHLHYGLKVNGSYVNPKDYLNQSQCANVPRQKPSNPQISKSQIWYDLGDTIEISASADGATSYYMSMFKDDEKIVGTGVSEGKYSIPANQYGEGKYSAYFSCSNDAGTVDTEWIDFSVVGPAHYTNIYTDQKWYDETDEIQITVDTICAKGQVIGIDKEGVGRVYTGEVSNPFVISASDLGKGDYSVYYSVYNGSGSSDTERIHFSIYGSPEVGAVPKVEKSRYGLKENITLTIDEEGKGIKERCIGIDKVGEGRVYTENVSNPFTIAAKDLGTGDYSAYYSVYNGCGGYDTEKVYFTIYDEEENLYFSDVKQGDWYYDAAIYVSSNGIMTGLTQDTFGPDVTLTRAQFATILYRMNGEPAIEYSSKFPDVAEGQWYTKGVLWANSIGVVGGYGDGKFGPDDNITREQMAVMMYRYAKYKEYDISKTADIGSFKDASQVSSYAEEAFKWAVGSEIIGGKAGNMLEPQGKATRAECATIIMRFMEQYN